MIEEWKEFKSTLGSKKALLALEKEILRRKKSRKLSTYYLEEGPYRRELYPKHMDFFRAGKAYRERCMIAGNRIGKTEGVGGYESTLHLTGLYPDWWEGKRFKRGINAWVVGKTGQTVRDILQYKLLGPPGGYGTGLIPEDRIVEVRRKAGNIPDAIEIVLIKHVSGSESRLGFKSFDQGRQAFEGTEQDLIWLDEECPDPVYGECVVRTMTTNGIIMLTFTPLQGLSDVVLRFMPGGEYPKGESGRYVISATWDDVPHLTAKDKEEILESTPDHLRDARSKGIPHMGAGAIYPVDVQSLLVEPFEIPPYWYRVYGMDVGWNRTAAVWGAWARDEDVLYLYSEHYAGQQQPALHAQAIRARGDWIPGVIDPAARGRSQVDGQVLYEEYIDLGLNLIPAENAVEAGIYEVWSRMTSGRLKIFSGMSNLLSELRLYRRDDRGWIVKTNDHLMDAMRYLVISGLGVGKTQYQHERDLDEDRNGVGRSRSHRNWTNPIGGYG